MYLIRNRKPLTLMEEMQKSIAEAEDFIKSTQMGFDFSGTAHHKEYTRVNARGTVSNVKAKGSPVHHSTLPSSPVQEEANMTDQKQAKKEEIWKRADGLRKQPKADLIQTVKRNYRVIDTREMDKTSAINHILEAEYGNKALTELYYHPVKRPKVAKETAPLDTAGHNFNGSSEPSPPQVVEKAHDHYGVEAHGTKDTTSGRPARWRKTFASAEHLNTWTEKYDASTDAQRDLDQFEAHPQSKGAKEDVKATRTAPMLIKNPSKAATPSRLSAHDALEQAGLKHSPGSGYKPELDPYQTHKGNATHAEVHKHLTAAGYRYTSKGNDKFGPEGEQAWHSYDRSSHGGNDKITLHGDGNKITRAVRYAGPHRD
jgi:hypothetical protein